MIHILITSHGGMAEGMMQSAKMLVREQEHLDYATFGEEMSSDELDELYEEKITSVSPDNQHLIPCGTKGRTSFNTVSRYSFKNENVTAIYGINLLILIKVIVQRGNPDIKPKNLAEYLQQQSGPITRLSKPQGRMQKAKVRFPNVRNEPLY